MATEIEEVKPPAGWLAIIDKMIEKGTGVELLAKVFELQQKSEMEAQRRAFVAAFADFKAEAPTAIRRTGSVGYDSRGSSVAYNHVELDVACNVLVPLMSKHGLAHSWETTQGATDAAITVTCHLSHVAGHRTSVTLRAMPDSSGSKNSIQAIGSAVYYLERYTFLAACGMAQGGKDDDGQAAGDVLAPYEDIATINELIEQLAAAGGIKNSKAWHAAFLKWLKVESLDQLNSVGVKKAVNELKLRLSENAKKGGQ